MPGTRTRTLHPAGSVGNLTSQAVERDSNVSYVAFMFTVEAVGATPTVTFKFQGSMDNVTWFDLQYVTPSSSTEAAATIAVTGVGQSVLFPSSLLRHWRYWRCVTTANTNVTYRSEVGEFGEDA